MDEELMEMTDEEYYELKRECQDEGIDYYLNDTDDEDNDWEYDDEDEDEEKKQK